MENDRGFSPKELLEQAERNTDVQSGMLMNAVDLDLNGKTNDSVKKDTVNMTMTVNSLLKIDFCPGDIVFSRVQAQLIKRGWETVEFSKATFIERRNNIPVYHVPYVLTAKLSLEELLNSLH